MSHQASKLKLEQYGLEPIPEEQKRVKWYEYAMIQGGFTINFGNFLLPALAVIKGGLPIVPAIIATVIGATLAFICMSILSIPGAKHGIPAQYAMRSILGTYGARFITSPVRLLSLLYWFSVQIIGITYLSLEVLSTYFHIYIPFTMLAICLGTIMIIITLIGFDAIKNTITKLFPFLVLGQVIMIVLFSKDMIANSMQVNLFGDQHYSIASFFIYASLVFVQYIASIYSSADITRYAKSSKHGFFGILIGSIIGYTLIAIAATMSASLYQQMNPFISSIQLTNSPILIMLIVLSALLSTISININNAYSAAFSLLNSFPRLGRIRSTLVFGVIAMTLSLFPSLVEEADFYVALIGLLATPMAAVVIVDFILNKKGAIIPYSESGRKQFKYNKTGIILIGIGAILYYFLPEQSSPGFITFIITGITYAVLSYFLIINRKDRTKSI